MTASAANQMTMTGVPQPLHLFFCMVRLAGLRPGVDRDDQGRVTKIYGPRGAITAHEAELLRLEVDTADARSGMFDMLGLLEHHVTFDDERQVVWQTFAWDNLAAGAAALVNIGVAELPDRVVRNNVLFTVKPQDRFP